MAIARWSPPWAHTACIRCGVNTDRCVIREGSITWWCGCKEPVARARLEEAMG